MIVLFFVFSGCLFSQKINTNLTYSISQPTEKLKSNPLLIVMHGYGSNENNLFDLAKLLNPKFFVASLRGAKALGGDGYCWFKIERLANKQIKYDYKEAEESRSKIVDFIRALCKTYKADSNHVYLMGFSQGAIMSYDILLKSNFKVKGIMALSGRLMNESAENYNHLTSNARVFVAHGSQDEVLDISELTKVSNFFKKKIVEQLTLKTYAMPHTISDEEVMDIKLWLNQNLLK
jgi:phospholipase/carboxylesterase